MWQETKQIWDLRWSRGLHGLKYYNNLNQSGLNGIRKGEFNFAIAVDLDNLPNGFHSDEDNKILSMVGDRSCLSGIVVNSSCPESPRSSFELQRACFKQETCWFKWQRWAEYQRLSFMGRVW